MKTKSTSALITVLILSLVSIGVYYFAYCYVVGLDQKTAKSANDLAYLKAKYNRAVSLKVVATKGENRLADLDKYIIHEGEEITVVKNLEQLASSLSLVFATELINSEENSVLSQNNGALLHIAMTVSGTRKQVDQFLALIESLPYNVKLNKVDIYQKEDVIPSTVNKWQARLDFSLAEEKGIREKQ